MEIEDTKLKHYWLIPAQAFPAVLLLLIISPLPYLEYYGKALTSMQLIFSCATIPLIVSLKDVTFRIWACSVLIIPLPILIFIERISFDQYLIAGYYLFLVLFFIFNYPLRKLAIFIPLLLVTFFGSIIIWGVTEMFSQIPNEHFFYMSPILNFFLNIEEKITEPILFFVMVSAFAYLGLVFEKYKKRIHL